MFKKKYQFITVGGATRDFMFYDPAANFLFTPENFTRQKSLCFEYGAKIQVEKTYFTFGGGGANAAVNLAKQGFKTAALISVGDDDSGRAVLNNLRKHGVDIRFTENQPGKMTAFSFILTAGKEKEHVIFLDRGASNYLKISQEILRKIKTKWFYIASLSGNNWRMILDRVMAERSFIAWNPGGQQLKVGYRGLKKYLAETTVFALNKDEAIDLVLSKNKQAGAKTNNIKYLLREIKKMGPDMVLVTSGAKGADVYDGKKFYYQKVLSKKKKTVDTTGVGDCFSSTFVGALEKTQGDIKKSMTMAVKNAANLTRKIGAQNGLIKVL